MAARDDSAPSVEIVDEGTGTINERLRSAERIGKMLKELEVHGKGLDQLKVDTSKMKESLEASTVQQTKELEKKLNEQTAELKKKLGEIQPKPANKLSIIAIVVSVLLGAGGIIFAAGRYPDRSEFNDLRKMLEERDREIAELKKDVAVLQVVVHPPVKP